VTANKPSFLVFRSLYGHPQAVSSHKDWQFRGWFQVVCFVGRHVVLVSLPVRQTIPRLSPHASDQISQDSESTMELQQCCHK
jgi:hypothetical protein